MSAILVGPALPCSACRGAGQRTHALDGISGVECVTTCRHCLGLGSEPCDVCAKPAIGHLGQYVLCAECLEDQADIYPPVRDGAAPGATGRTDPEGFANDRRAPLPRTGADLRARYRGAQS